MGLSLKKLGSVLGGVERQINPFDNGATYSNPHPTPTPAPAPVGAIPARVPFGGASAMNGVQSGGTVNIGGQPISPAIQVQQPNMVNAVTHQNSTTQADVNKKRNIFQKLFDQANPLDNGRTFQNPTPTNQRSIVAQATHNMPMNIAGDLTAKPFLINPAQNIVETGRGIAADITNNPQAEAASAHREWQNVKSSIPGFVGSNVVELSRALGDVPPAVAAEITGNATAENKSGAAGSRALNQTTLGQALTPLETGIANITHMSKADQAASGLDPNASGAKKYFGDPLAGTAGTVGLVAGVKAGGAKVMDTVKSGTKTTVPIEEAPRPVVKGKAVQDQIIQEAQPKATVTAKNGTQTVELKAGKTGIDEVDQAAQNLLDHYNSNVNSTGNDLNSVVRDTKGKAAGGQLLAGRLGRAIRSNLTEQEDAAVYDALQGVENADLTPKAAKVVTAVKPLYDKGLEIRQGIDQNVNAVHDYAPRVLRSTVANAVKVAGGGASKIKSLLNLGDLESGFSKSRQYGKFQTENGDVGYGKAKDLGITKHNDGSMTLEDGTKVKQVSTNTHELEANTGLQYLGKASHVSSLYHSDTARLQAKASALNELNTNPTTHGLFTRDQIDAGNLDNMKEVNVPGLKDANGENFFAKAKDAKNLERDQLFGHPDARSLPGKMYDAATNVATQFIVMNPLFHGANQLVQSMIASGNISGYGGGWARLVNGVFKANDADMYDYLNNGGHIPDYGSHLKNVVSKATFGASKLSSKGMAAIETKLRVGLYKASIDGGMDKAAAVKNIDKFLGDSHQLSRATQRVTLFGHYFKTVGGALVDQAVHPVANAGATINTAATAAIFMGLTQQYQNFTGNQNAYVRMPGELGTIKEGVKAIGELKNGEIPTIITNRINPVAKEAGEQVANHDLFTDKPVTDSPGGRVGHALTSLVAPTQQVSQVTSGKRTKGEVAANQFGLYTPHAKGYQAAPKIDFLNKKVNGKVLSGNGEAAQTAYFDGLNTAKKTVHGDNKTEAQFNDFLARSHDPKTGQSIQNTPSQSIQNSSALFDNDKLRATVKKFESSQPSHDPMWDLPDDKLKQLFQYKEQFTGDAAKKFLLSQADQPNGSNWIQDITKKSSDYYNNLPSIPGSKPPISRSPAYPKFDDQTTTLLSAYNNGDATTKSALMSNYAGELSSAFNQIGNYTNEMRKAEGAPALKSYPQASPETQAIINHYNSLPQHDGKKGGNATRYAWIQSNPDAYKKMQDYLTQTSMQSLISNASLSQFADATPNQKLLKDIKNVGQYDIAQYEDANGNKTYALNPTDAYSQNQSSSGSGSGSGGSSYYSSSTYKNYKLARYFGDITRYRIQAPDNSFRKGAKISIDNATKPPVKLKVASGVPILNKKVALKRSRV